MTVSELIELAQKHLVRYGDGPVRVETASEVLDVESGDVDKFEPGDEEPWSLVLVTEGGAT